MVNKILVVLVLAVFGSGCAVNKMEAQLYPNKSMDGRETYYVVKLEEDERGIETLITDKLLEMGKTASAGKREDAPSNIDAIVTYVDKWMWDITMYMLELTIIMREPESDMPVAKGYSMHTSLTRKSPEEMVDEVVTNIFNAK